MPTTTFPVFIDHRFDVSEISNAGMDEAIYSPVIQVDRNDLKLSFQLKLAPEQQSEEYSNHMRMSFQYVDGPKESIEAHDELSVIGADGQKIILSTRMGTKEFNKKTWEPKIVFPRSLPELGNEGYLSADGKYLHILLQLTVEENIFFASISHKFVVNEGFLNSRANERIGGSIVEPNQETGDNTGLGLYMNYINGPLEAVTIDLAIIVVKNRKREVIISKDNVQCKLDQGYGRKKFPRTITELSEGGYLDDDNKLHVIAELSIPESAFLSCGSGCHSAVVQVDSVGFHFHQELATPAATNLPTSTRVEFISRDDETHLWAHKEVLSIASNVFKDLFDPNKPEETKMESLKQGRIELDDLSGDALKQMMHFIYLRHTDKAFEDFAMEIIPVADRFLIKGLMNVCENSLLDRLNTMELDCLTDCLEASHTFNLTRLRPACVGTLSVCIKQGQDIDQKLVIALIALAEKHDHPMLKSACELNLVGKLDTADRTVFLSLLSVARLYHMDTLTNHCVRWFKNNFTAFKADGFVDQLMDDKSENGRGLIHFLLESIATLPYS